MTDSTDNPPAPREEPAPSTGLLHRLLDPVTSSVRRSLLTVAVIGCSTAVILFLYHRPDLEYVLRLSSVTWDRTVAHDQSLTGSPTNKKPVVAILLGFRRLMKPVTQDEVDALYKELAPPEEILKKFAFVSPARVRAAMPGEDRSRGDRKMLEKLRLDLNVSLVAAVTITAGDAGLEVTAELVDTETGSSLKRSTLEVSPGTSLGVGTRRGPFFQEGGFPIFHLFER